MHQDLRNLTQVDEMREASFRGLRVRQRAVRQAMVDMLEEKVRVQGSRNTEDYPEMFKHGSDLVFKC